MLICQKTTALRRLRPPPPEHLPPPRLGDPHPRDPGAAGQRRRGLLPGRGHDSQQPQEGGQGQGGLRRGEEEGVDGSRTMYSSGGVGGWLVGW